MARFLFVVPPLSGHVNPTISVGRALERRGHACAWVADRVLIGPLLPADVTVVRTGEGDVPAGWMDEVAEEGRGLRGAAALEFLWRKLLVPLADGMLEGVEHAVDAFGPDVLVVDQQALAGAVVARRRGIPWATSATTPAELSDPYRVLPKVGQWVRDQQHALQVRAGVPEEAMGRGDLRFSEHLVVAFSTEALTGPVYDLDGSGRLLDTARLCFVGPSIADRREPLDEDGPLGRFLATEGRKVLVTLGTVNARSGARFFEVATEAAATLGLRAVVVAPPDLLGTWPEGVFVAERVPQLAVLRRVDAVVCHAGNNTVCESLAEGLPLVVAPIRDDQPVIAEQVERAGAGVRVRFGRVRPAEMAEALAAVLDDPRYREGARLVQASFAAAGGADAAAAALEALVS